MKITSVRHISFFEIYHGDVFWKIFTDRKKAIITRGAFLTFKLTIVMGTFSRNDTAPSKKYHVDKHLYMYAQSIYKV